ncbi:hypothetical protein POM88_006737 [Heracleum sosnowskyi]|uniref:Uncharacterized protein n=1 Tax=Heracleum sosnowskyi TaxID=360622 RepID=A0AAD8N507_9APIA|nr:hypothetical protein POM88_006737 [Heracleum sosnowskyi]
MDESEYFIPSNNFDFFEMEELSKLAKQNVYLADVVGVVIKRYNIRPVRNTKLGTNQMQVRMKITDGKHKINVIFWEKFAEEFQQDVDSNQYEEPLILIIYKGNFPTMLKILENEDYTMKLQILEVNIQKKSDLYLATDMFKGFNFDDDTQNEETIVKPKEYSAGEPSGSSYHLDNMSET